MQNIAFFTESAFIGKVSRDNPNARTDLAWMIALEADHFPINYNTNNIQKKYDLGIIIIPKNNPNINLDYFRACCDIVAVMQEGPHWFFQDYVIAEQINYINNLISCDILYVHNEIDKLYYKGLIDHKDIRILPTLMIEDCISNIDTEIERKNIIIGGNFVHWYSGIDSYMVARLITDEIYCPSMGRKQLKEEALVKHLPYSNWKGWMNKLNEFRIGIHLMRTYAAGTFALNCSYLGIPCIGYSKLDTQRVLHPILSVEEGDLQKAKSLLKKLNDDEDFYIYCGEETKKLYKKYYREEVFLKNFK